MQKDTENFDVIVIGGGHAGTESALISAKMGVKTLLITQNIDTLGQMSCNPAIGGIGKGHLVKEIDALGGIMGEAIDKAGIQFRTLNSSKGPAVQATRAQADRELYKREIRQALQSQDNLWIIQQTVEDLILDDFKLSMPIGINEASRLKQVKGVVTNLGQKLFAKSVVLTTGTFLGGVVHIGEQNFSAGRMGCQSAHSLAKNLRSLNFKVARLKTGTPPRIAGNSINFNDLQEQPGDNPAPVFSFLGCKSQHPKQVSCYITHTNEVGHAKILENIHRSAMYSGNIEGVGPRYCPSIEDKITRFKDKNSHQIFLEPEGLTSNEFYPNGISTSLPMDVQYDFVRSIKGLEKAQITRFGYAIEYDFFDPRDLLPSLETKQVANLFFAGQINGTTGYEEAAAQGLVAGINAALLVKGEEPFYPKRQESYLGVLIDDLLTQGAPEPYRMFTSRAEFRLILREDNADLRLTPIGEKLGTISSLRRETFAKKKELITNLRNFANKLTVYPQDINNIVGITSPQKMAKLISRPDISLEKLISCANIQEKINNLIGETDLTTLGDLGTNITKDALNQVEIEFKYSGYIEKQQQEVNKILSFESAKFPKDFDYSKVLGLSNEVAEKLKKFKPANIGIASRIPGVTPAAISILLIYLKKIGALEKIVD